MALQSGKNKYKCPLCLKVYPQAVKADACRDSHNPVYILMSSEELNKLMHAIHFVDMSIIPMSLLERLETVNRKQSIYLSSKESVVK